MPAQLRDAPWLTLRAYVGGEAFTLDDPERGLLDAGNVLGPTDDGWHDMTCDAIRAGWRIGATETGGPLAPITPGFATVEVLDLDRTWDPANDGSPFRHRFGPNTPLELAAWFYASDGAPVPMARTTGLPAAWRTLFDLADGSLDGLTVTGDAGLTDGVLTFPSAPGSAMVDAGVTGTATSMLSANAANLRTVVCQNADKTAELFVQWVPQFATWNVYRRTGGTLTQLGNTGTSSWAHRITLAYDPDASVLTVTRVVVNTGQTFVKPFDIGAFTDAGTFAGVECAEAAGAAAGWSELVVEGWDTPVAVPQFVGRVDSVRWETGTTTITATDGLADLAAYDTSETPQMPVELPSERLARVLTDVGYRGATQLEPGEVELAAGSYSGNALAYAQLIATTELGALWCDRAGVLRFRGRTMWSASALPKVSLGPDQMCAVVDSTASGLTADNVRNVVAAGAPGKTEHVAADAISMERWGARRLTRADLLCDSSLALEPWALGVLRWTGDVRPAAIERLELWPTGAPELWPDVANLELGEVWQLDTETAPELLVCGWAHEVTATDWRVLLTTTAAPTDPLPPVPGEPTGGTIVDTDGYRHHTFGTDNAAEGFTVEAPLYVDVLVVGGGGCGGDGDAGNTHRGGGGGGGGWREAFALYLEPGTYSVTVGAGGDRTVWLDGRPSQFGTFEQLLAAGGGGGTDTATSVGRPGASGAGGAAYASGAGYAPGGAATPPGQGHPGRSGATFYGGGGGGQLNDAGAYLPGDGRPSTIAPNQFAYGQGGYGANNATTQPTQAPVKSGWGGGGGNQAHPDGHPGGSGTVVVRYQYPIARRK